MENTQKRDRIDTIRLLQRLRREAQSAEAQNILLAAANHMLGYHPSTVGPEYDADCDEDVI